MEGEKQRHISFSFVPRGLKLDGSEFYFYECKVFLILIFNTQFNLTEDGVLLFC